MNDPAPTFVTADTTIGDAVARFPVTAEIMMSYGLHCVGCHVSGIESIRQGAMGHGGMDEEDVEELVKEMNEAIAEREGMKDASAPLHITRKAAEKIKDFAAQQERKDVFLRVTVRPGGCSGFVYGLDFETEPAADDIVVRAQGFPVHLAKESLPLLQGAVLDFVEGLHGQGFTFDNPKAAAHCGCGKSFS